MYTGCLRPLRRAFLASCGLAVLLALCAASAFAGEPRITLPLDSGWRFKQAAALSGVEEAAFDDSSWMRVDLPHTWNRLGNEGIERSPLSNAVQGVGWYRLRFNAPAAGRGGRYFLEFDGVSTVADVWLNGHYLGKHAGAFARFRFDASAAIDPAGDNLLVVKADNSRPQPGSTTQDVIPLSGDFFMFGGVYRSVRLIVTAAVHVDLLDFGGPGMYLRALKIDSAAAVVQLTLRLVNDGASLKGVKMECEVADPTGRIVATASSHAAAPAGRGATVVRTAIRIPHPRLWQGVKDPYVYRASATLRSSSGALLDRISQPLGLRTERFDGDGGFFLNGDHLFLKAVSMHQDRPEKGWAISRADQAEDFDLLADMGANAVRLAHYQHDQYSYDLADERGIVVWAEIPLVNKVSFDGGPASEGLAANARQQLTELIRQNYNHPSIALWSIANEVDLTATQAKKRSAAAALLTSLNALAKKEDPSRPTTLADCCEADAVPASGTPGGTQEAIVGVTDAIGYNRYFGWYYGTVQGLGPMLDRAHARHPGLPMAVSEYGAGAALTQHSDDPGGGPINPHGRPHPEEYQTLYHEASWDILRARPYLWGVYIWNMFDSAAIPAGRVT